VDLVSETLSHPKEMESADGHGTRVQSALERASVDDWDINRGEGSSPFIDP